MKKSTLRLLIREAIEQVFEAEIKYNVGDRVEIDSSENGGIGTVELASHPTYAIKFDQTGITDSHHFSDLRPFDDEEEAEKNKDIDTGLDENTELNTDDVVAAIQRSNMVDDAKQLIFKAYKDGKLTAKNAIKIIEKTSGKKINENNTSFPDQLKGNDDIIWKKQWERNNKANYGAFYKGHDIEHGGVTFDSVDRLNKYIKSYILSNNWYNKLKSAKPLDENSNPTDTISLDVPLFIRMLEYAREDAKTDMDLHNVTGNALKLSTTGKTLTMTDYNQITSKK